MDWVPLRVDAVLFYRVTEPALWVTRVLDGSLATHTLAQTTLRAALGTHTLSDIMAQRRDIGRTLEVGGKHKQPIQSLPSPLSSVQFNFIVPKGKLVLQSHK